MTFQARLENLRAKPEHIRKQYAFWSSFGVTAIVFMFWLASFTAFGNAAKGSVAQVVDQAGTPAQSMLASVGSFFGDVKDMVFGPKKVTYSVVQASPGDR